VIPVYRDNDALVELLRALKPWDMPVIVVDGDEDSTTCAIVEGQGRYVVAAPGRGAQIAEGIRHAATPWIWVLHADCQPSAAAVDELNAVVASRALGWGRCDVLLPGLPRVAWWMNWRSKVTRICTGDQGMFFHGSALESIGGYPSLPLMEDIEVSKLLKHSKFPFYALRGPVTSSPRRWVQNGVLSTILTMWWCRLRYFFGVSADALYAAYYGGIK